MKHVARATTVEEVYGAAMDCLEQAVGVRRSSVLLFDDEGVMRFVAWRGLSDAYRQAVEGHTPWKPGTRGAEPLMVPNVDEDPALADYRPLLHGEGIAALAFVPLQLGDVLLGKFMLYFGRPHVVPQTELVLVQAIAGHVAFAIDRFAAEATAEKARSEVARSARRLRILAEQSAAMAGALDSETALQRLTSFLVRHVADYCVTYSLEADGALRCVAVCHRDAGKGVLVERLVRGRQPKVDDPVGIGAVVRTGQALLAEQAGDSMLDVDEWSPQLRRMVQELQPRSSIVVPLRARGRTLGASVVTTTADSERSYTVADLALLDELAGRAALLVDNARLYHAAQEAVRMRDEVVAVVSHDIRGPLQTITTACAILGMPGVSAVQHQQGLEVIGRAVAQMERLTTDLLDISRIEAGGLQLQLGEVDAAEIAAEVGAALRPTAEAGGIALEVAVEPGLPRLWADRNRLVQVLSNLLTNAFKFTPEGGKVVVSVSRHSGGVRMAVSDTGCGIPPEHIPRLFDRFWQADRKRGAGAGLGLAIVKGIVEGHGGTVEVHSVVGQGSTFSVSIPSATAQAVPAAAS
ncbi:GAF domain-containing sensor histidine kinase [Paraliomyxa miuraensis]|uniref:GAF domain-containing sensor histidine kinase n=1 Tax=Paraliomyxa miuraensis TaxID=376150 RepID=UPI002251C92D|nr:GAF domain-containing sensor histidine kinase [Paraliomyxa miuraensis]MCX4239829.1 GAF domain-containing sensor histidine kinase [Paraliomyxa miuraensis]